MTQFKYLTKINIENNIQGKNYTNTEGSYCSRKLLFIETSMQQAS